MLLVHEQGFPESGDFPFHSVADDRSCFLGHAGGQNDVLRWFMCVFLTHTERCTKWSSCREKNKFINIILINITVEGGIVLVEHVCEVRH